MAIIGRDVTDLRNSLIRQNSCSRLFKMTTAIRATAPQTYIRTTRPVIRHPLRSLPTVTASNKNIHAETATVATIGATAMTYILPQMASAAQEAFILAEGEPLIVQAGWAALAASFTMSIAIVVWGRSGL